MDLSNYSGLQSAVADFLNRSDLNTGGQIGGFIQLAEASMRRRLRRATGAATLTFTAGTNSKALPATVAELRSMTPAVGALLPLGGWPLAEVSFEMLNEMRASLPATGIPRYFAVLDGIVYVAPAPSSDALVFTISYFEALVALSNTNTTNSVLTEAPDAYLYGACLEAAPFLEHDERIPVWQTRFDNAIEELNEKRQREEFSAGLKKARLPIIF